MAIIWATCDEHGDVEMTHNDVQVRVCIDNGNASYAARCPEGGGHFYSKPLDHRMKEQLIASGCHLERWRLPKELDERREERDPVDHDLLIDAHKVLSNENEIARTMGELTSQILYEGGLMDEIRRSDGPFGNIKNV